MIHFEPKITLEANQLECGDKYDQSVVHLLSTLESDCFLVEKKGGAWIVTTGLITPVVIAEAKAEITPKKKGKFK